MRYVHLLFAAVFLVALSSIGAAAEHLPEAGNYVEADRLEAAFHSGPGRKAQSRKALDQRLKKNPSDVLGLTHRGYVLLGAGDFDFARRDYERALKVTASNPAQHRHVLWSYGWALYDMKDIDGALEK